MLGTVRFSHCTTLEVGGCQHCFLLQLRREGHLPCKLAAFASD